MGDGRVMRREIGADAFDGAFDADAFEVVCTYANKLAPMTGHADGGVIGQGREVRGKGVRGRVGVDDGKRRRERIRNFGGGRSEWALEA